MPSYPAKVLSEALSVKSLIANKKNKTVSDRKIVCNTRLSFNVPTNINKVNKPHITRYHATPSSLDLNAPPKDVFGKTHNTTNESQNDPYAVKAVAPKVLFILHSCNPANI